MLESETLGTASVRFGAARDTEAAGRGVKPLIFVFISGNEVGRRQCFVSNLECSGR